MLLGNFESRQELQKFGFLATVFFLIICTYWVLRPIKDSLFFALIGAEYLWLARIVSLLVLTPLIVVYSKLVDTYKHHRLFYALMCWYALCALGFMICFMHPEWGLANTARGVHRILGWAWYVYVDSFGSLMVTLFWAFATDTTLPQAAQRGFPLIALLGQLGNIVGPTFITAKYLGFKSSAPIVGVCAVLMLITGFIFWLFMRVTPKQLLKGYSGAAEERGAKASDPGFLEGLRILVSERYLVGMFALSMFYEVVTTVFDYHFKQGVGATFIYEIDASAYLASYAQYIGVVSTLCVFFGINNIQRYLGIRASLLLLPSFVLCALGALYLYPTALTVAFWIMVFSKSINYALNQPTMKQLYIPTTSDVKYKTQAWLDMFGSRGSKSVASMVNGMRGLVAVSEFITVFSIAATGVVGVWMVVALCVAKMYDRAITQKRVVC